LELGGATTTLGIQHQDGLTTVVNSNETETPKDLYSSVVSKDSVRLFFMLAALNDLDVLSADIQNEYLLVTVHKSEQLRT
jgi:hypothetical protein